MKKVTQAGNLSFVKNLKTLTIVCATTVFFLAVAGTGAQAQTLNVLYAFGAGGDGSAPIAGVTLDSNGNVYGTACAAGPEDAGTVFQVRKRPNGSWIESTLHQFRPSTGDGGCPSGRVVFGPSNVLYGVTTGGGIQNYYGVVYSLQPPITICKTAICPWNEKVIYRFGAYPDAEKPGWVDPVFDQAGNMYGTTMQGGQAGQGTVFKLSPAGGGNWTESVLHSFNTNEGGQPASSVLLDHSGNIWGTTPSGPGNSQGTVFELTPSGSGYTASMVHTFLGAPNDGAFSNSGLVADTAGNLYGATAFGGLNNAGAAFELTPSGNNWTYSVLYTGFNGVGGPWGQLTMDAAGNLYGTSYFDGAHQKGTVFKLTPNGLGGWTYTSVHDFTGGDDGAVPYGGVAIGADGNLYGTASAGGRYGRGVVWQIVP